MNIKAVLFDLDDTLTKSSLIYDKAQDFASDILSSKYSLDSEEFKKVVREKHLIVARTFPTVHTRHSRILVFRMALDEFTKEYDLSLLPEVEDKYWDYFLNNIDIYPGVEEMFSTLKGNGFKIAIVSDGSLSLRIRKVKAAGLIHYVDEVIASEEVIFEKPFGAIFTLALSRLDIESNHALMVGNNLKNDIRGAQLIGIKAGLFDPDVDGNVEGQDGTIVPDFTIKKYPDDLISILSQ